MPEENKKTKVKTVDTKLESVTCLAQKVQRVPTAQQRARVGGSVDDDTLTVTVLTIDDL